MGYVETEFSGEGTELQVGKSVDKLYSVTVTKMPFEKFFFSGNSAVCNNRRKQIALVRKSAMGPPKKKNFSLVPKGYFQ